MKEEAKRSKNTANKTVFDIPKTEIHEVKKQLQFQAPRKVFKIYGELPGVSSAAISPITAPQINARFGQIIEVYGEHSFSWAIQFLKTNPLTRVAWLSENGLELFPMAVAQEAVSLDRILFLENISTAKGVSILLTLLRSQLFQLIVFDQALLTQNHRTQLLHPGSSKIDVSLRKLQIVAEDGGCVLLMLSQYPLSSFGIHIQIEAQANGVVSLKKLKGGYG